MNWFYCCFGYICKPILSIARERKVSYPSFPHHLMFIYTQPSGVALAQCLASAHWLPRELLTLGLCPFGAPAFHWSEFLTRFSCKTGSGLFWCRETCIRWVLPLWGRETKDFYLWTFVDLLILNLHPELRWELVFQVAIAMGPVNF